MENMDNLNWLDNELILQHSNAQLVATTCNEQSVALFSTYVLASGAQVGQRH